MTRQETINSAVAWAIGIANDSAHGYDQKCRWGPDFDCSSFVITAWQRAGVDVRAEGASYTGNMYFAFLNRGFRDVTNDVNLATGAGLEKGDVLLNKACHTEMFVGGGRVVKASINEFGGATGGQTGDQSGREIYVGAYYNYPWDCVLRYEGDGAGEGPKDPEPEPTKLVGLPTLKRGDRGETVKAAQILLNGRDCSVGKWGADGDFGPATEAAVTAYQRRNGLEADGIIGPQSWASLLGVMT